MLMKYSSLMWSKVVLESYFEKCFWFIFADRVFPNPLKIAKVTPAFQTGHLKEISNYRLISFLPCFSEMLERIMHKHLYSYLVNEKNIIFEAGRLPKRTCHCSISWWIHKPFEKDNYTLGGFIGLSKVFYTIDCAILLKKLEIMELGVKILAGSNVPWQTGNNTFKSHLNRKSDL